MNAVYLIVGLLLGIVLVAFGAQNAQPVTLYFFQWNTQAVPLVLALGAAMLLGVLLTLVMSVPGRLRGRRERQELRRQLEAQARPTPLAEPPVPRHEAVQ